MMNWKMMIKHGKIAMRETLKAERNMMEGKAAREYRKARKTKRQRLIMNFYKHNNENFEQHYDIEIDE